MTLLKKTQNEGRLRPASAREPVNVNAYSYHNVRNEQDSDKRDINRPSTVPRRGRSIFSKLGFFIFIVVITICIINILYLSSNPKVVFEGSASNNELYKFYEPEFLATSTKLFKSSLLNNNKITVDTNSITKKLTDEFPEFNNISVTLPLINHRPIIYADPSDPAILIDNSQGQYLLNQNGVAILQASSSQNFTYLNLPVVTDQSGLNIQLGQLALTSQDISFIQTVNEQLEAKGVKATKMVLPQATSELDVNIAGEPYFVKFNLENNDPKEQAGSYLATAHYLKSQNITPSQYIDVRTDGRAYYQ